MGAVRPLPPPPLSPSRLSDSVRRLYIGARTGTSDPDTSVIRHSSSAPGRGGRETRTSRNDSHDSRYGWPWKEPQCRRVRKKSTRPVLSLFFPSEFPDDPDPDDSRVS